MERAAAANESARALEAEHETAKEVLAEQQRLREATEAALLSQEEAVARERAAREECDRLAQLKRVAQAEERSVAHISRSNSTWSNSPPFFHHSLPFALCGPPLQERNAAAERGAAGDPPI